MQRLSVGFHHGCQHLLARVHAQAVERVLHVTKDVLNIEAELRFGCAYYPQRGLRARLHFGASFLCLRGTRMFTCGRKEPPPSAHQFNSFWDIAGHEVFRRERDERLEGFCSER